MKANSYKYFIISDKKLVIEILRGTFEITDYINLKKSQFEDKDYDPDFDLVLDIRGIEDRISEETIRDYAGSIKPVQLFTRKIKAAVVAETPLQVVGATLYSFFEDKKIDYKIFSTVDAALSWLDISKSDLKDIDRLFR